MNTNEVNQDTTNEIQEEHTCACCGNTLIEGVNEYGEQNHEIINGDYICYECINNYYVWSDYYNEYIEQDYSIYSEHDGDYYNENDSELYTVYNTNNEDEVIDYTINYSDIDEYEDHYYFRDDMERLDNGDYVPEWVIDNGIASYCGGCGSLFEGNDLNYSEDEGDYFCYNCYEDSDNTSILNNNFINMLLKGVQPCVYSYHGYSSDIFNKNVQQLDGEIALYLYGIELETCTSNYGNNEDEVIKYVSENMPFLLSRDSTLGTYGIEFVSMPMSSGYIKANKNNFKKMLSFLRAKGYTSHDNGNCGLHIHVSRPQNSDIIDRILLILENFKNELKTYSRRNNFEWCEFMSDNVINRPTEDIAKSIYFVQKNKNCQTSHRVALNLANSKTIEFRFMRGTLNFDSFMASIEMIQNIVNYASNLSFDLNTLSWNKLTSTYYCKKYCQEHDIKSDKKVVDNTNLVLEKIQNQKQAIEKLKQIYKNIIINIQDTFTLSFRDLPNINDVSIANYTRLYSLKNNEVEKVTSLISCLLNEINCCVDIDDENEVTRYLTNSSHRVLTYSVLSSYYKNKINSLLKGVL